MLSGPLAGSLRLCLQRRPPLVCFGLCLLALGAACIARAAHVRAHALRDPDPAPARDWNSLLELLSHLNFCTDNGTWRGTTSPDPPPGTNPPFPGAPQTLSILVGLTFNLPGRVRPNATCLALTTTGRQLGLEGPDTEQPIHMVAVTPWPPGPNPQGSCLSLAGPSSMLPQSRAPPHCIVGDLDAQPQEELGSCYQPHYQPDPALATMLTIEDRRLCSQRLLLAGLTMLCFCALLLCTAGLCLPPPRDTRGQL